MSDHPTMTCEEALQHLLEYLDGELPDVTHADVADHLRICRSCYSRAEFERRLRARLGSLSSPSLTPVFAARIRSILERFPG
jgi:anti-sigma factor (TIGR02949 family)